MSGRIFDVTTTVLAALVLIAGPARNVAQASDAIPPAEIRQAVERGTAYLAAEGLAWMNKQHCASCHHVPMMVWALTEARQRGYGVDEKALGDVTTWAIAEKNHAKVFPDLPLDKSRTETDYLGPLLMALAVGADKGRDEAAESARHRLLTHAVRPQEKDGSWNANSGGRPPVHASRDVQTGWLLLAVSDRADAWPGQRKLAADWLSRNPPAENAHAIAMRLLVHDRLGKPAADLRPQIEALLRLQNEDGGWSQTSEMKSDAFATGLSLTALSGRSGPRVAAAIGRGQAFLVKNQQPDGSWPMTSRPAEPPGPGPARDLRPIKFFGTAWATIGLVRSGPDGGAVKR
jgi:Prenyltransferase and squalene oxidase repeat